MQIIRLLLTNCLSVFGHFEGLAFKGLTSTLNSSCKISSQNMPTSLPPPAACNLPSHHEAKKTRKDYLKIKFCFENALGVLLLKTACSISLRNISGGSVINRLKQRSQIFRKFLKGSYGHLNLICTPKLKILHSRQSVILSKNVYLFPWYRK